jgi:hypothetical protein
LALSVRPIATVCEFILLGSARNTLHPWLLSSDRVCSGSVRTGQVVLLNKTGSAIFSRIVDTDDVLKDAHYIQLGAMLELFSDDERGVEERKREIYLFTPLGIIYICSNFL